MNISKSKQGGFIIFITAGLWGLFWIPLRYIESSGVDGLAAVVLVFFAGAVFAIPPLIYQYKKNHQITSAALKIGATMGLAATLYFAALILTDVIRAVFLFYLLPFWAILSARIIYGVKITFAQTAAAIFAMVGLYLLLAGEESLPLPTNMGDWFALGSGLFWGISLSMLRANENAKPSQVIAATFIAGIFMSVFLMLLFPQATGKINISFNPLMVSLILSGIFIVPSIYGQAWGARFVSSATAAILTMSEILFATLSYWLLGDTLLGTPQVLGGIIIATAGIFGLLYGESASENH